jgi:hypothetical protein
MLRRTLILTFVIAAVVAAVGVTGASSAGKPSFKFEFVLPPLAPFIPTVDPIDMACVATLDKSDGKTGKLDCNNSGKLGVTNAVNPHPPKDEKIFKLPKDIFNFRAFIALYPDGSVRIFAEGVITL